jgi:hypothetical protein
MTSRGAFIFSTHAATAVGRMRGRPSAGRLAASAEFFGYFNCLLMLLRRSARLREAAALRTTV